MALVYNVQNEAVKVQAFGNWFEFKPGQIKNLNDNLASFLTQNKSYMGFVGLPENFDELNDAEKKQLKLQAREQGIQKVKEHLEMVVRNLTISLQRDLDQANIKTKSTSFVSEGELEAIKKLESLKNQERDVIKERADEADKLIKKIIEA